MDSGQIDFYQHDTLCSNTCHSTKFDVLINRTRLPPGNSVQPSLSCLALDPVGGQVSPVTGRFHLAFSLLLFLPPTYAWAAAASLRKQNLNTLETT